MPAAAAPAPLPRVRLAGTWTLEKRQVAGIALGLFCLGVIIGFRVAKGGEALIREAEQMRQGPHPCADCAERAIQDARATEQAARASVPFRPLPGNVPPPPAPGDHVVATPGTITDTSKAHVADATFLEGGTDASSVPGM